MSVINQATIQFMTTQALGKKRLFTIIRKLNGHPLVIQVYLSMNILIISIRKLQLHQSSCPQEKGFKKSVETQIQALDKFLHSKGNELQGQTFSHHEQKSNSFKQIFIS